MEDVYDGTAVGGLCAHESSLQLKSEVAILSGEEPVATCPQLVQGSGNNRTGNHLIYYDVCVCTQAEAQCCIYHTSTFTCTVGTSMILASVYTYTHSSDLT